jgi:hypothetical protein
MVGTILCACVNEPGEGSYLIACPGAFDVIVTPSTRSLRVGTSVVFSAEYGEPARCTPPAPEAAGNWRWRVANETVAKVDSVTGLFRGLAAGHTQLIVRHVRFPNAADTVQVDIIP